MTIPKVVPKVVLGVPSMDMMHADCAFALMGLVASSRARMVLANPKSCYVWQARNVCVGVAQQHGADWLLFVDSDVVVPADALDRLLAHGKDVVGATYIKRAPPHSILGSRLDGAADFPSSGLVAMAEMPTGCLLIRTSVFDTLSKPYFRHELAGETMVGEDILFCRSIVKRGVNIFCDMGLSYELRHLGMHGYNLGEMVETMKAIKAA
jgi:hypothetical protein